MEEKLKKELETFLASHAAMRKYQKSYFSGNKAALKQAIYYENQTDNLAKKLQFDFGLTVTESKGPASQQSLL